MDIQTIHYYLTQIVNLEYNKTKMFTLQAPISEEDWRTILMGVRRSVGSNFTATLSGDRMKMGFTLSKPKIQKNRSTKKH